MKNLLSLKVFGRTFYFYNLIIVATAMIFIGLYLYQVTSEKRYQQKLDVYTESYISYVEIAPEKVKAQITTSLNNMQWTDVKKYQTKLMTKAQSINNNLAVFQKVENANKRLMSLLKSAEKTNIDSTVSKLDKKIDNLLDFVEKNNWRRLTRLVSTTQKQLNNKKLDNGLVVILEKNLSNVRSVTERSLLSNYEKSSILTRINKIDETSEIKEILAGQQSIKAIVDVFLSHYDKWYGEVGSSMSLKRDNLSSNSIYSNVFLFSVLGLLSVFLFGWINRNKMFSKKQSIIEDNLEHIFDSMLFDHKEDVVTGYQEDFYNVLGRIKEHLSRRMHFGQVVEQGIPFPSMLIDSNLKVTWVNELAQDKFGLDFNLSESQYLSWDHVKQFTSFDDFDPVTDAIKFKNGGIFDTYIKTKNGEQDKAEFFISPVEINGSHYAFISFQLQSYYQEVLENNKTSILNPVMDTLNYLAKEKFETTEIEKKKLSFDSKDTQEIYGGLSKVINRYIEAITSLQAALEIAYEDNKEKDNEIHSLVNSKEVNIKVMMAQTKNFKSLRDNITELDKVVMSSFSEIGQLQTLLAEHLNQTMDQQGCFENVKTDIIKIQDNTKAFKTQLHEKRSITADLKGQRVEIKHLVNQMISNTEDTNFADKMNHFMNKVDQVDQFYRDLDVSLGKLEYFFEELNSSDSKLDYKVDDFKTKLEREFYNLDQVEQNFEAILDTFANNLEEQFKVLKEHKMFGSQHLEKNLSADNISSDIS